MRGKLSLMRIARLSPQANVAYQLRALTFTRLSNADMLPMSLQSKFGTLKVHRCRHAVIVTASFMVPTGAQPLLSMAWRPRCKRSIVCTESARGIRGHVPVHRAGNLTVQATRSHHRGIVGQLFESAATPYRPSQDRVPPHEL